MTTLLLFYRYHIHKHYISHSRLSTRSNSSCTVSKGSISSYGISRISNKSVTHSVINKNRFSRICIV